MNQPDPLAPFLDAFATAAHGGCREAWFEFAERPVRVRAAGDELFARIVAPFSHLQGKSTAVPSLTIDLWDAQATGVPAPLAPVGPANAAAYGDSRHSGLVCRASTEGVRLFQRETCRIVGCYRDATVLPPEERAKPLRHLLDTWYLDRLVPVIHGAAVAADGHGALIAGRSGAGKSTTALACAAAGLSLLGDDQVGLEDSPYGPFRVHSLYSAVRIEPRDLADHPWLACGEAAVAQPGDKSLVFASRAGSISWVRSAPVHLILLPTRSGPPGLHPVSRVAALHALAPSTLIGVMSGGTWTLERLTRLTASTPAFSINAPLSPDAVSALVREAFSQVA